ncbi:hypothetical protein A2164_03285 [Candidatus Curtissbacteria bacterium RBG_13_35_7]|uniref:Uncharacterized protein n=1 Tax=Candidatus Curtissbacteria bacterium RBG_13_35_7 TaxID=1797705 RepID=A0A1F5G372_9BACT|nr:MAG: hypothetical protein A2164_03285 [Candidatus Curtissbacteria bacterium RBG_13_35_7]
MKAWLQGEKRLGFEPVKGKSQIEEFVEELHQNELLKYLFEMAYELDSEGAPIQKRIGRLALRTTSLVNTWIKEDCDTFLGIMDDIEPLEFRVGSSYKHLVLIDLMVRRFIADIGRQPNADTVRRVSEDANLFAESWGGIQFNEGPEITALCTRVALRNIAANIADSLCQNDLDIWCVRRMLVVFGQTSNEKLCLLKVKQRKRRYRVLDNVLPKCYYRSLI